MKHSHYTIPAVGTTLPAQPNEHYKNPGTQATIEEETQWLQAQAQADAFRQNERITDDWLAEGGGWGRWLVQYQSGRMFGPKGQGDPDAPTPVPPRAKVVVVEGAENGGIFFSVVDGKYPVCEVPDYEKITAPEHYK